MRLPLSLVISCFLDELRNSLEGILHPVFRPHPLLSRTIEQRESMRDSNYTSSYTQDFPSTENVRNDVKDLNVISLSEDIKPDKISDDITEFHSEKVKDFGTQEKDMVEKRGDYLLDKNVQQTEESRIEEDNLLDEEDDLRWDKESGKSENSSDVESDKESFSDNLSKQNDSEDDTNVDSYGHQTSRVPEVDLSTNIPKDCAGNGTISSEISEAFMTANVCELLETMESDKKGTFSNIQRPLGDSEPSESYIGLDVFKDSSSVGVRGGIGSDDGDLGEQFGNGKPSCSNFESDQEEAATGQCDKHITTNFEDNSIEEKAGVYHVGELDVVGENYKIKNNQTEHNILEVCNQDMTMEQISNHPIAKNSVDNDTGQFEVPEFIVVGDKDDRRVTEDVLKAMENTFADKFAEHGENSGDAHEQSKENPQEICDKMSIHSPEKKTTTSENITLVTKEGNYSEKEEDITSEVQFSEVNIKDDSSRGKTTKTGDPEMVEEYAMTSHGRTEESSDDPVDYIKDETMKESIDHSESCSTRSEITVDLEELGSGEEIVSSNVDKSPANLEYEDFPSTNAENNVAIMGSNMKNMGSNVESGDGINNYGTEYSQLNTSKMDDTLIRANLHSDGLERETPTENASDAKKISPRLGERASSLLSALKDEITGVSSKDIQSKESSNLHLSATHTSGGDVVDVMNTQPDPTGDHSTSEIQ